LEALLKFILVIILIYYGLRLTIRYVVPWLLARFVAKQQEKFNNMNGFQNQSQGNRQDGDINIKKEKPDQNKDDSDFGEYVDFEEVKE